MFFQALISTLHRHWFVSKESQKFRRKKNILYKMEINGNRDDHNRRDDDGNYRQFIRLNI